MDIRKSDIDSLEEKVRKLSYERYLPRMKLSNVRSFAIQDITFDFPVTAIIGTNGGGKSTILGAIAIAYKSIKPGDFFPKSNIGDNSMANWRVDYEIIDRKISKSSKISRNARFIAAKWRRDNLLDRDVVVIPIQRTVPANEQAKFRKFIGLSQNKKVTKKPISKEIAAHVSRILGKDASQYERVTLKSDPSKSILVGMRESNDYSQFHFGAGEASIIEMVSRIEAADDFSLILIEEIENGLHPLATQKMVEYLFDVAKRKKAQIVFTTRSEYALSVLPPRAIWACIDGKAYQGKLNIESLRALTGLVSADSVIFVEDDFAKDLVEEIIRQYIPDILHRVQVHKAGGFPYVVEVLKFHRKNPAVKHKAIAVVDGDNPKDVDDKDVIYLPDDAPEAVVFGYVSENVVQCSSLIKQRCQVPSISQDEIVKAFKKVELDTTDHHLYFSKIGDRIGFISELVVRRALCSIYVENNENELKSVISGIEGRLNQER